MSNNRLHVSIPRPPLDVQQPAAPRGPVPSDYAFRVSPPHPFIGQDMASLSPSRPQLPRRQQATSMTPPPRPRIQSVSDYYPTTAPNSFPQPHFHRATSHREYLSATSPQSSNSNLNNLGMPHTNSSVTSFTSSYAEDDHYGLGSASVLFNFISITYLPNPSLAIRRCRGRFITKIVCIVIVRSSAIVTLFIASFIA